MSAHTSEMFRTTLICGQSNQDKVIADHVDGLVQDCSISSALTMEIVQSCTKASMSS